MKLIQVARPAVPTRGFNQAAADAVYKSMTGMDAESALSFGRLLLVGGIQHELMAHREELNKAAAEVVTGRATVLRKRYARAAVAKERRGQDNTLEVECLAAISKAFDYTESQRTQFAAARHREGGRFVAEHHKIETNPNSAPADNAVDQRFNGTPPSALQGADLSHYQQAYRQIQDLLSPFHNEQLGAMLHVDIKGADGEVRSRQFEVPTEKDKNGQVKQIKQIQAELKPNDRIESASVSVKPTYSAQGGTFDAVSAALGRTERGARIAGAVTDMHSGVLNPDRLKAYNDSRLNPDENDAYSGGSRAFRSLERGSALVRDSLGESAPPQLRFAAAVANHVGQFGPEAQKVFGPAADRAAYRYRGTQRAPDPKLKNALSSLQNSGLRGQALRDAIIGGQSGAEGPNSWNPGPVLRYFHSQLPNPDLNELQRRSGVIPPSEGVIIDAQGRVAAQSVGYADDWYLPFNLKNLTALKGGEYIRTRSFGGPTTEDIYTAMISGARSMTVVSHNGVYTVDLDRNLRGGRRFNDKAGRMVGRYGQLLDAVRSKQVSRGTVSPSRLAELRTEAMKMEPDDSSPEFRAEMTKLTDKERQNPVLSQTERSVAATDWLGSIAAQQSSRDGRPVTSQEFTDELAGREGMKRYQASKAIADDMGVATVGSPLEYKQQVLGELQRDTPQASVEAIAALAGPKAVASLGRAMDQADQKNRDRVSALTLNGKGYDDALHALQEQFPYYIGNVTYHPWRGATGIEGMTDRTLEGTRDSGYVAPRFNRPQKAEAGYFNRDVTGQGKVKAQSTRYQNYAHQGGKIRPVGERPAGDGKADAPAATGVKSSISDADIQRVSDLEMLDELLKQTTFAPGATLNSIDVAGDDIRSTVAHPAFPDASLRRVFAPGAKAALTQGDPAELHNLLQQLLPHTQGPKKAFAVNERTVATFRNNGKTPAAKVVPSGLSRILEEVGQDHSYEGVAYDPVKIASIGQITQAYTANSMIRGLVDKGELPEVSSPDFGKMASAVQDRLTAAFSANVARHRAGMRVDDRPDVRDAEGLSRAMQLNRRYLDAKVVAPTPAAAATPAGDTYITEVHAYGDLADQRNKDLLNNIQIAGPDQRVVYHENP